MTPRIGIIDLQMGNLRSVANAVSAIGYDTTWVSEPAHLDDVTHLILPGVGSYTTAMAHFARQALIEPVRARVASGTPLLGICLGMQLLSSIGDEGGPTRGLALIPGRVIRFDPKDVSLIPHMGWNELRTLRAHPVTHKLKSGVDFYYVHSFWFDCEKNDDRLGVFEYGGKDFTAAVARENVVGIQFHPEKSQATGLRLLENFCDWDGKC